MQVGYTACMVSPFSFISAGSGGGGGGGTIAGGTGGVGSGGWMKHWPTTAPGIGLDSLHLSSLEWSDISVVFVCASTLARDMLRYQWKSEQSFEPSWDALEPDTICVVVGTPEQVERAHVFLGKLRYCSFGVPLLSQFLYLNESLTAKYVTSERGRWLSIAQLSFLIHDIVLMKPGLYPLLGEAFPMHFLTKSLGLSGTPYEPRAQGTYSTVVDQRFLVNEPYLSFERQVQFWQENRALLTVDQVDV